MTDSSADQSSVNEAAASLSHLSLDNQDGFLSTLASSYTEYQADLAKFSRQKTAMEKEPLPLAGFWFQGNVEENIKIYRNQIPASLLNALCLRVDGATVELRPLKSNEELNRLMSENDLQTFLLRACDQGAPTVPNVTPEQEARLLNASFNAPYRGTAVQSFVEGLEIYNKRYRPLKHYGMIIPLIQSSGTGKSRLVAELGKQMPTFSVCFRGDRRPTTGWPPKDLGREFFQNLSSRFFAEEVAAAFLGAFAQIAHEYISELRPIRTGKKSNAEVSKAARLNEWMGQWKIEDPTRLDQSTRHKSFERVMERTRQILDDNAGVLERGRPLSQNLTNLAADEEKRKGVIQWHMRVFRLLSRPGMGLLAEDAESLGYSKIIFAFDECTELNPKGYEREPKGPEHEMSLIALQRILKAADSFCGTEKTVGEIEYWFLLLDTNSSIGDLAPSGHNAPSFRLSNAYKALHIWSYLGFDQMVQSVTFKCAYDALSISHLRMYGRPYWSTLDNGYEAVRAAQKKLIYEDKFKPSNTNHVLAVFANRVLLELGDNEQSSRMAAEAVRSHMRILMGVSDKVLVTKAPSEPLLAIAAADVLNSSEECYKTALKTLFHELILKGVVLDRGLCGELCARLLLTVARDKATKLKGKARFIATDEHATVPPVSVSDFFETLFGKDLGLPENDLLCRAFFYDARNVWINFTHFIQIEGELNNITLEWLLGLWSRGVAVQCIFQQTIIDLLIVTYRGDLHAPFDISKLGYIVVQVKARSKAASTALVSGLAGPAIIRKDKSSKPEKYVAILMDLDSTACFQNTTSRSKLEFTEAVKPEKGQKHSNWAGYMVNEPQRYCLSVRGHSPEQYPFMKDFAKEFKMIFEHALQWDSPHFQEFRMRMEEATSPLNVE